MTDSRLNYQTPALRTDSRVRTVVAYLITFGTLYCLASLFGGFLLMLALWLGYAEGNDMNFGITPVLESSILMAVVTGTGIAYLWCAFLIRRRSRNGTRTALVGSMINILCSFLLLIQLIADAASQSFRHPDDLIFGILVLVAIAGANVFLARLLIHVLRQMHGKTLPPSASPEGLQ